MLTPLELTTELRWILGRPCFTVAWLAQCLRQDGHAVDRKAEDEQAVAIHWMLNMYLKHEKNWRAEAALELKAMKARSESASSALSAVDPSTLNPQPSTSPA